MRDEKVIPLEEAVRRLTSFPCDTLRIQRRGRLQKGQFADVVVFDPSIVDLRIAEHEGVTARASRVG